MNRLISEQKVLDILSKYRLEESTIAEEVKAIPSSEPNITWVVEQELNEYTGNIERIEKKY